MWYWKSLIYPDVNGHRKWKVTFSIRGWYFFEASHAYDGTSYVKLENTKMIEK